MRILLTNDDGINAPGLRTMEDIAAKLAGPSGDVWVVAPATEQSGVGHCINYNKPVHLSKLDERRFSVDGTPADCVLAALGPVMGDLRPDVLLSGVNRGNNAAENVLYSGTIGAAMEGALQGLKSIALSQFYGPGNVDLDDPFEAGVGHGAETIQWMLDNCEWDQADYRLSYNVNFPAVPAADVKGMKITTQGWRSNTTFTSAQQNSPNGKMFLWAQGGPQHDPTGPGTDVTANLDGYTSITPLRADLTAHDWIKPLQDRLG